MKLVNNSWELLGRTCTLNLTSKTSVNATWIGLSHSLNSYEDTVMTVVKLEKNTVLWTTNNDLYPSFVWERGLCGYHIDSTSGAELDKMIESGDFRNYSSSFTRGEKSINAQLTDERHKDLCIIEEFANDPMAWPEHAKWQRLGTGSPCGMGLADAYDMVGSCSLLCLFPCVAKAFLCPPTPHAYQPETIWVTNHGLITRGHRPIGWKISRHGGVRHANTTTVAWESLKFSNIDLKKHGDRVDLPPTKDIILQFGMPSGCPCCIWKEVKLPGQEFVLKSKSMHEEIPYDPDLMQVQHYTVPDHIISGTMKYNIRLLRALTKAGIEGKLPGGKAKAIMKRPNSKSMDRSAERRTLSELLGELKHAFETGHISQEEYDQQKQSILSNHKA